MSATAAVVQMAIDPKMPRIKHLINHLDHQSNLVSNWEVSLDMDPLSRVVGDLLATTDYIEIEESKGICVFREIAELRQAYNLQSIQVTVCKVLLNFKFPMAVTKGNASLYKI